MGHQSCSSIYRIQQPLSYEAHGVDRQHYLLKETVPRLKPNYGYNVQDWRCTLRELKGGKQI